MGQLGNKDSSSLAGALLPETLTLHWDLNVCVSISLWWRRCTTQLWLRTLLTLTAQTRPTSWEADAASLAAHGVHWCKGHSGSLSCVSAGILIKEDKQKTIASLTTRKPNGITCVGSQTIDIGIAGGHPNRVGAETEREPFHYVNEEKKNEEKYIFEVGIR